ncbi:MAG: lysophospholipid acyltransferase family protein [Acidobacteriota bacterium]
MSLKKKIRYRSEYLIFKTFIFFIKISPVFFKKIYRGFALSVFKIGGRRLRNQVETNLKIAFPSQSDIERKSLAEKIYNHFSTIFIEIIYLFGGKSPEKVLKEIKVEGLENLTGTLEKGSGAILFSAHFGNWELIPFILSRELGENIYSIARKMDNPLTEKIVTKFRSFMGSNIIYKDGSLRKMLRVMEDNKLVYLLIDQNTISREGVLADFFGKKVVAVTSVSQIFLKKKVPVIPLFINYRKDSIVLKIGKEVKIKESGDYKKDLAACTQHCLLLIEEEIKNNPEQWFWFHDRWKERELHRGVNK